MTKVATIHLARIEVRFSPTPESPGLALAGSINLVSRSAFDRSQPLLNASAYLLLRDDARDFRPTPGPGRGTTRIVNPGFEFSSAKPVNARFGFTLSGASSPPYQPSTFGQTTRRRHARRQTRGHRPALPFRAGRGLRRRLPQPRPVVQRQPRPPGKFRAGLHRWFRRRRQPLPAPAFRSRAQNSTSVSTGPTKAAGGSPRSPAAASAPTPSPSPPHVASSTPPANITSRKNSRPSPTSAI